MLKNIQAVIFDLDNTLLHFEDYWETAVKETFANFHLTKFMNMNDLFSVYLEQDVIFCLLFDMGQITLDDLRKQRLKETLKAFGLMPTEQDCDDFQNSYVEISYQYIKPNREYLRLLSRLTKKYKLAIMTNGSSNFQRQKLKRTELDKYIHNDYIFISEEMGYSKPSPELYQSAIARMNVIAEEVLFVGDSLGNDVIGSMKAGMQAVWVNKDDGVPLMEQEVSFVIIKDVLELNDILL